MHPASLEFEAEPKHEVPDPFVPANAVADRGEAVQHESLDTELADQVPDRPDEDADLLFRQFLVLEAEALVEDGQVHEHEGAVRHEVRPEEFEGGEVLDQLVRGLGDGEEQGPLAPLGAADQELETQGGLPRPDASGHEDHVPLRNASRQDVV